MRSPSRRSLLATASVAVALAAADTYVVVLALPDMMSGVGLGIESLQRATPIVSGFLLGYIAMLPFIGRLADLVPRQLALLGCLAVFVVGSAVTALAVDLPVLVGGRLLQGIGGGGLVPATLAIVAELWSVERRGTPLGIVGGVQELGSVLGPILGALVLAVSDWRAIFWLNAALGIILAVLVVVTGGVAARVRWLPTSLAVLGVGLVLLALWAPDQVVADVTWGTPFVPFDGTSRLLTPVAMAGAACLVAAAVLTAPVWLRLARRADLPGAACLAVALGSLILSFASADPAREVVGPWGLALLPLGLVALGLYVWRHRVAADPLLPRGMLRSRVPTALWISVLVGMAIVAVVVDVPVLVRVTTAESQTGAALLLARFLVAVPVGAVLGGMALRRLGAGAVAGAGLLLAGVGLWVMGGWGHGSVDQVLATTVVLVAVGFGVGLAIAPVNAAALADGPPDAAGVVSATVVVARMTGMVVGLALLTAVGLRRFYASVAALPDQTDPLALERLAVVQVQTVFLGGAVAALMGAVLAVGLGVRGPTSGARRR